MRLALQFPMPDIEELLRDLVPDLDMVVLPEGGEPLTGSIDAVLGTSVVSPALLTVLENTPELKWLHILGTGMDGYPLELLRNTLVTCSKGATAVPIAEWVMAMVLAHAKRLPQAWISEPPEHWYMGSAESVAGKTLGIVGFGEIGQAIAKRALGFDMQVLASVRRFRPSPMQGVELLQDVDELIARADHLVLALPATQESEGLLDHTRLQLMKSGSHLINISRASLIDHDALREELDKGTIAAASLDVVDPEPLPEGHWLYRHEKVKLSPHISWSDPASHQRMMQRFISNLMAWRNGDSLEGVVDTEAGY